MNCRTNPAPALGALIFFLMSCVPGSARAATWTVTTNGDDSGQVACTANACPTLRDAITSAAAGDTISLNSVTSPITLAGTELTIKKSLTVSGPGATSLSIQQSSNRNFLEAGVFDVTSGTVTISGVGVLNGTSGGITNAGNLSLINCNVSNCVNGVAAIYNGAGTLTVSGCTISGNTDGGINNSATAYVSNSTLAYNSGSEAGAILNNSSLQITNCTLFDNSGYYLAGGIANQGTLEVTNCSVIGNYGGSGVQGVGGISTSPNLPSTVRLLNTLVAGNYGVLEDDVYGAFNTNGTAGYNLIGDMNSSATGFSAANHDVFGLGGYIIPLTSLVQTNLSGPVLANNGGPTQTVALIPGSKAIDAGDDAVTGAPYNLSTDQRGAGHPRLCGQHVDIGAYEYFAPSVSGLTPASQSTPVGTATTWSATYADSGGYGQLSQVQICVGANWYPVVSLYAEYLPKTNLLYLFNANNVAAGGFAPGSNHVITTTLGSLNCAATTVSGSGDNLTVNWNITPATALIGVQSVYLQASDAGAGNGTTTSWAKLGTWTIVPPGPSVVSLVPATLSSRADGENSTTATYADSGGNSTLTKVQICVGDVGSPATSFYAEYLPATNLLYLFNASNVAVGGYAPGSNHVITTGLGSLNCSRVTVTGSGDSLSVNWSITPAKALEGTQGLYLQAADAGTTTSWYKLGTWAIAPAIPSTISLTPASLTSEAKTAHSLTATYADGAGYSALTKVQICVGSVGSPSTSLYAEYLPATNLLYLFNANNVAVGGFAPGSANVITTTLGSLDCSNTTVTGSGVNLSVVWNITPAVALEGNQGTYLQAADAGTTTSWTKYGTWIITTPYASVVGLTPLTLNTSTGTQSTLTATYADGGGYAALTKVQVCVGGLTLPSTSLYAEYLPATNSLYLFNASNVAVGGYAPGSANVITTPLGSLNCAETTVSGSGNNLTVAWSLTPGSGLIGSQAVYLDAVDSQADSGWSKLGAWSVSGDEISGQLTQNGVPTSGVTINLTGAASASVVTGTNGQYAFTSLSPGTYSVAPAAQAGILYQQPSQTIVLAPGQLQQASANFAGGTPYIISGQVLSYANGGATSGVSGVTVSLAAVPNSGPNVPLTSAVTNSSGAYSFTEPWGTYSIRETLSGAPFLGQSAQNVTVPAQGNAAPNAVLNFAEYQISGSVVLSGNPATGVPITLSGPRTITPETINSDANGNYVFPLLDAYSSYEVTPGNASGHDDVYTTPGPIEIGLPTTGVTGVSPDATLDFTGSQFVAPANDDFADAQVISGNSGTVVGNTQFSTLESDEPNPTYGSGSYVNYGYDSVWYKFVAPSGSEENLALSLNSSQNSGISQIVNLYSGASLSTLNPINGGQNFALGAITPGDTYYIQIMDVEEPGSDIMEPGNILSGPAQFTLQWATYGAPANDDFANATVLTGPNGLVDGSTLGATVEPSEPLAPGATVWYEYTAPSGSAGVLSLGGGQDIAVFTGTALANLQQVVSGSVFVQVNATPGTKYFVQISNRTSTTQAGQFTLSWSWNTAPANDDFANAQELTGTSGSVNGTTLGATVETGEPNASENTVWYAYTAPSSSVGALSIVLANQAGSANVYSEGSGGALTLVQPTSHSTDYETTPGTTYAIQVQPSYGIPDNFTLNWSWTAAPANDNLANAQVLTGNSGQVNGTDVAATLESGEKNVYFGSVWYQYTAPSSPSGILTVSLNSPGGEFFNVYTASSVANWTPVASPSTSSDTPGTTFATTAGTTYDIQVGAGQYEDLASFTLTWSWNAIANNDNFANAEAISGVSGSVNGTTVGSTVETGEPNATLDSVWYQYTAPSASSGNLLVEWGGVQNLNVYTGTSVSSLTPVTTTMIDGGDLFATTPGAVYYFQVWATAASGENAFDLTWLWTVPPPNDNFAQAQPISGPSGSVTGTTVGATVEPNEPYGYEKSVWYAYTTPSNASGQITFSVTGSGFASPTWFDVYTGPSLANLSLVTTSLSGSALFTPVPGTTYHLQLEGSAASTGSFTMTWALPGVPANDNFAKAQALTGASGTVNGSTVNSTIEPGDPNAAGGDNSVWYSYTDSSTTGGSLNLTAPNSGDAICVYTGTSLSNLTEVAGGFGLANLTTSPGVAYYVEVMSPEDYVGPFSLAWSWTANPGAQSSSRDQGATLALPAKKPSGHSA